MSGHPPHPHGKLILMTCTRLPRTTVLGAPAFIAKLKQRKEQGPSQGQVWGERSRGCKNQKIGVQEEVRWGLGRPGIYWALGVPHAPHCTSTGLAPRDIDRIKRAETIHESKSGGTTGNCPPQPCCTLPSSTSTLCSTCQAAAFPQKLCLAQLPMARPFPMSYSLPPPLGGPFGLKSQSFLLPSISF